MSKIKMIVAVDKSSGISKNNKMPWHLGKDFKWFQFFTTHTIHPDKKNAIIMGRKTWLSLPKRPLKDRLNVVLTRSNFKDEGAITFSSYVQATQTLLNDESIESIFIIGGETVYQQIFDKFIIDEIFLTRIDSDFECDQFFPEIEQDYDMVYKSSTITENDSDFRFEIYRGKQLV